MITFLALDVASGMKTDYVEAFGGNLVVMVFAKQFDDSERDLYRSVDMLIGKNVDSERKAKLLNSVLILLSEHSDQLEKQLKHVPNALGIKYASLAMMLPDGPPKYNIEKEASVTVIVYEKRRVLANYAFKKGELNEKAIKKIVEEVTKFLEKE